MPAQTETATLNPLAVTNADVLRYIVTAADDDGLTQADMARALNRDPSNLRKTLKALEGADLILPDPLLNGLTRRGRHQLTMIARAHGHVGSGDPEGPTIAAQGSSRVGSGDAESSTNATHDTGNLLLNHAQIRPDPDNARTDWESDAARAELDALAADIADRGLLQNLVVRRDPDGFDIPFIIVGGERRWRAIGQLIATGEWPHDRLIPCRRLDTDDLGHRLAALAENLQRRNLNPLEKARAFEGLAHALIETGTDDASVNRCIADRIGVTIEHVQQHRSFLKLDADDQQRLTLPRDDPRHLGVRDARARVTAARAREQARAGYDDLPPVERLVMAEVLHAVRARASYTYGDIRVGGSVELDPAFNALRNGNWLRGGTLSEWGAAAAGWFHVARGPNCPGDLFDWLHGDDDDAIKGLAAEQTRFLMAQDPPVTNAAIAGTMTGVRYLTPWVAEPDERCPRGQAVYQHWADQQAERAAQVFEDDRRAMERQRLWARARERHLSILTAATTTPDAGRAEDNRAIAEDLDRPLPWTLDLGAGTIVAHNGQTVRRICDDRHHPSDQQITLAQMTVVAVNTVAGHPTPAPILPEPDQALDGSDPDGVDGTADDMEGDDA